MGLMVKTEIQQIEGIPIDMQLLFFKGRHLNDAGIAVKGIGHLELIINYCQQGCTRSARSVSLGFGPSGNSYFGVGQDFAFLYIFLPNRIQVGDCEAAPASVILT